MERDELNELSRTILFQQLRDVVTVLAAGIGLWLLSNLLGLLVARMMISGWPDLLKKILFVPAMLWAVPGLAIDYAFRVGIRSIAGDEDRAPYYVAAFAGLIVMAIGWRHSRELAKGAYVRQVERESRRAEHEVVIEISQSEPVRRETAAAQFNLGLAASDRAHRYRAAVFWDAIGSWVGVAFLVCVLVAVLTEFVLGDVGLTEFGFGEIAE